MDRPPQTPTLDSVKSFAEYAGIGMSLAYQFTRAKCFPMIQHQKKANPNRARNALDWLRKQTMAYKS